jgi:hypothetical protein
MIGYGVRELAQHPDVLVALRPVLGFGVDIVRVPILFQRG